jgi:hypothetical protein
MAQEAPVRRCSPRNVVDNCPRPATGARSTRPAGEAPGRKGQDGWADAGSNTAHVQIAIPCALGLSLPEQEVIRPYELAVITSRPCPSHTCQQRADLPSTRACLARYELTSETAVLMEVSTLVPGFLLMA